jgi:hypothetical protein
MTRSATWHRRSGTRLSTALVGQQRLREVTRMAHIFVRIVGHEAMHGGPPITSGAGGRRDDRRRCAESLAKPPLRQITSGLRHRRLARRLRMSGTPA